MEQREEGGNNGLVWQLPTRMKYGNIKLSRPIGPDSGKPKWIVKALNGLKRPTGVIRALDTEESQSSNGRLKAWSRCAGPGPSLNLDSPKVFTETLEIAHHGFTPKAGR